MEDQAINEESFQCLSAYLSLQRTQPSKQFSCLKYTQTKDIQQSKVLMHENSLDLNSIQKDDSYQSQNSLSQKKGTTKKQKKNYSKNYRKKQKQYVQHLKVSNQKYLKKIEELSMKLQKLDEELKYLKYGEKINGNVFDNLFQKQKQSFVKEFANKIQGQNEKWDEMWTKIIFQWGRVYGFAGTEKNNLLNYYMSQIIENLLIDHHKLFVLNVLQDFTFSTTTKKYIFQQQQNMMGLQKFEFKNLKKYFRKDIADQIKQMHMAGKQFYQSYLKFIDCGTRVDFKFKQTMDVLVKWVDPFKYVDTLRWYEQNKYSKELQLLKREWYESFQTFS